MFLKNKLSGLRQSKQQHYKAGQLLPVMTAAELIEGSRHARLLKQFKELSALNEEHFAALYEPVFTNYAEFVQLIPSKPEGVLGGLLNEGLARSFVVLQTYLAEYPGEPDPMYIYAAVTAGLLRDLGKVILHQKVLLTDEEGNFIDHWRPFEGSMVDKAEFYKFYPINTRYMRLETSITPLLARQIMPELGFLWLASDFEVFSDWLDVLRGDSAQGGRLARLFTLFKFEDVFKLVDSFGQFNVDVVNPVATEHAEIFYNWLKNGIENGDIKVNSADAFVHVVEEGVFVEKQIFKQFADLANVPVNMNVVFSQFGNLMGIAKKGGHDFVSDQYFSSYPEAREAATFAGLGEKKGKIKEGVVVRDANAVFVNKSVPDKSPMKAVQSSALADRQAPSLAELKKLSPSNTRQGG